MFQNAISTLSIMNAFGKDFSVDSVFSVANVRDRV